MHRFAVIIPTLNGGRLFELLLKAINVQSVQPLVKMVIDSKSSDETINFAREYGCDVLSIEREAFNHGTTRQMGAEMLKDVKVVIYLTQDAVLADEFAFENILKSFENNRVGAAYGRQLPHLKAGIISAHARIFNYGSSSLLKSFSDSKQLGIKTAFISNSFAAYRIEALMEVGGFPRNTILSEDTFVAAKMLLAGWKIYYCTNAKVHHSHDYSFSQEFKRYFDIGVFHAREPWIREKFGQAEGEGLRFVLSETKYLCKHGKGFLLISAFIRTCLKYIGYRLGANEKRIPLEMKKKLSMNPRYWN